MKSFKEIFFHSFNVIFEQGEHYMIRVVQSARLNIKSEELKKNIDWFCQQELSHAEAHQKLWQRQNDLSRGIYFYFVRTFGLILNAVLPLNLNLAISAAIEHFTAIFAREVLLHGMFSDIDPKNYAVLKWHCREEIQHRAVVFDVMKEQNGGPVFIRVMGLMGAVAVLSILGISGTIYFAIKSFAFLRPSFYLGMAQVFFTQEKLFFRTTPHMAIFLGIDYHPSQLPLDHLV